MDRLDGTFDPEDWDADPDEDAFDDFAMGEMAPPRPAGLDERRLQLRAYNFWAGLLGERRFPSIADCAPGALPEFADNSVLLDFSASLEDPAIRYLGEALAAESGGDRPIDRLADVPPRSLLGRITDHYPQTLRNEAPVAFEAEFVNHRDITLLYRGILLPFSSDGETVDFLYGVVNWRELADQAMADELLLQMTRALAMPFGGRLPAEDDDIVSDRLRRPASGPAPAGKPARGLAPGDDRALLAHAARTLPD